MDSDALDLAAVAEMSASWGPWWDAALAIQRDNPDVRARALRQSQEFGDAAAGMVMYFALKLHPTILETASAHCRAVLDLLGADPVAPAEYNRGVTSDGDAMDDDGRLEQLEDENRRLRVEVNQLRGVLRAVRDVADGLAVTEP